MSATATRAMTFEEFAPIYEDTPFELVEGIPTEIAMPAGSDHGYIGINLAVRLWNHVHPRKLGRVSGLDNYVMTKRDPDTVRGADISYFSYDTVPASRRLPGRKDAYIIPDLVAEVNSPNDRDPEIDRKIQEYMDAGVKIAVVLDPETRSATVHRRGDLPLVLDNGDELTFPDLLPGFAVAVRSLFEE